MARKPPKGKSLAELNPKLAQQWHTSKNGDLTPSDVFAVSGKKGKEAATTHDLSHGHQQLNKILLRKLLH